MTSRQLPLFSDTNPSVRNDTAAPIEPPEANDGERHELAAVDLP